MRWAELRMCRFWAGGISSFPFSRAREYRLLRRLIHNQKHYLECYFEACSLSFASFISVFQSVAILVKSAGYFLTGNTI